MVCIHCQRNLISSLFQVTTFRVLEDNYENLPSSPHITRSLIDLANYSSIQPPWEHQTSIPLTPQTPPVIVPDHVSLISTLEATTHGDGETDFNKLEIEYVELTGVGTVLGEAEILEKRRTHSLVTCETGVEAFQLDHSELKDLMQEYPVLEERLWRLRGVSVATTLLEETVEYKVRIRKGVLAFLIIYICCHCCHKDAWSCAYTFLWLLRESIVDAKLHFTILMTLSKQMTITAL